MRKTMVIALALIILAGAGLYAGGSASRGTASGKTKVEFFSLKREVYDIMEKLIADFEAQNPDVEIEQTLTPDPDRVLVSRMAGKDTPEIFSSWANASFEQRVDAGYVADITGIPALANVRQEALDQTRIKGRDYLIPISYNTMGVWYNLDIFARYNLAPPKTWAEFLNVCETLKAAGVTPALICGKELEPVRQDSCVYLISIPHWPDLNKDIAAKQVNFADRGKPYSQEMRDMAQRVLQYFSYGQADIMGSGRDQIRNDFATGKAAMYIEGSWAIPTFLNANPNLKFALMPWPSVNAQDSRVTAFAGDFAITYSATAKYPDIAKRFMTFMTSKEAAQYYAEKDGSISCIKGVEYVAPQLKDQMDFINSGHGVLPPDAIWSARQQDAIGAAFQGLYVSKDIEKFCRDMQDAWNNL